MDQAYAVGQMAVEKALAGKNAIMISIERNLALTYGWSLGEVPLSSVANREKKCPVLLLVKTVLV